jgi:hypothetical protein
VTPELQKATITTMKDRYARVMTAKEATEELDTLFNIENEHR